jgi:TolA-binding protein
MRHLRILLAVLAMLALLPSCEKRIKEVQDERPSLSDSARSEDKHRDGGVLPPPSGVSPRQKPAKNDQTLVLLADLCTQQKNIQQHLEQMDANNSKILDVLTGQNSKITAIETTLPKLSEKIDAQSQRTQALEERLKMTDDLVKSLQEQIRTQPQPANNHVTPAPVSKDPPSAGHGKEHGAEHGAGNDTAAKNDTHAEAQAPVEKPEKFNAHALQLRAQVKAAYNKVISEFPQLEEAAKASFGLGVMAEEEENWTAAVEAYSFVIKNFPKLPLTAEAKFNLARVQSKLGALENARTLYLELADGYPRHPLNLPALLGAADCLAAQNKQDAALRELRAIERHNPNTSFAQTAREKIAALLLKMHRYPEAVKAYKAAIDLTPEAERLPLELQLSIAFMGAGDIVSARGTLEALRGRARKDKQGWDIRWHLARTYEEDDKNKVEAARSFVDLANDFSTLLPREALEARLRAAQAFLICELSGHAAEEGKKVLNGLKNISKEAREKIEPLALFTLAKAAAQTGNVVEARERLGELRRGFPAHDLTQRIDIDEAEALAATGKPDDAVALLRQVILRNPKSPLATEALLRSAEYQERSGNSIRGANLYAELSKYVDEDHQRVFRLQRGILLQSLGQYDQSREIYSRLIADTNIPQGIAALAIYQTALIDQIEGKLATAVKGFEKFIESASGSPAVLGIDLTQQVENARFKISKLKLIEASQNQATADLSKNK